MFCRSFPKALSSSTLPEFTNGPPEFTPVLLASASLERSTSFPSPHRICTLTLPTWVLDEG
eukprot:6465532-Alexandrium_andersonii.AAC.1